jgi:cobalt-zinc-cadmium efflux system outer membrane protein
MRMTEQHSSAWCRWWGAWALAILLPLTLAGKVRGQGPQVDVDTPPGSPEGRGRLGPALGSSGTSAFDGAPIAQQESLFGGRPGPSVTRAPVNQLNPPPATVPMPTTRFRPRVAEPAQVPTYGELEMPAKEEEIGPPEGLTLDQAIGRLIDQNLTLMALRFEIPMAQADSLTASLRANPIFYADSQLVPYGRFSNGRPGGQTQYDVNVTLPIDVWRKRKARMLVAERAKLVTEAQFQDAMRLQIDNLYTEYVDVVAAVMTLRYSEAYVLGLNRLLDINSALLQSGFIKPADIDAIKAQLEQGQLQIREATHALRKAKRTLGLLLNMSAAEADALQVRSPLRDIRALPVAGDELIETALGTRPDLNAYRLGLQRAQADVVLARANRYSDVYLLWQPYTFQDNRYQGLKSAYSYAFGVTVSLPVYNRNQGNILRSKLNVDQSGVELTAQEKQVAFEVEEAVREFELSRETVIELEREVVPASRRVRDSAFRRFQGGETSAIDYIEAQKDYNEVVRRFRDALVRHRNSMLDLNTAVAVRILP